MTDERVREGEPVEEPPIGAVVRDGYGYAWRREADGSYGTEPARAVGAWRLVGGIRGSYQSYPFQSLREWGPLALAAVDDDLAQPEPMPTTSEAFAAAKARLEARGESVTARTIVEEAERV